jgi:hypothetical protein
VSWGAASHCWQSDYPNAGSRPLGTKGENVQAPKSKPLRRRSFVTFHTECQSVRR